MQVMTAAFALQSHQDSTADTLARFKHEMFDQSGTQNGDSGESQERNDGIQRMEKNG